MAGLMDILSGAGAALDVPGATVRNALSGRNPFQPISDPFSWQGRATGRDLLQQYGLAGEDPTGMNMAGGVLAEMALDPLTWAGAGLLSKGLGLGAKGAKAASTATRAARPAKALSAGMRPATAASFASPALGAYFIGDNMTVPPEEQEAWKNWLGAGLMAAPLAMAGAKGLRGLAKGKQATFKPNPKLPPEAQAQQMRMFEEGTELLAHNQPKQWKSSDLVGPGSTPEGQSTVKEALAQMAYSIGDAGPKKGKAARAAEFHAIRKMLDDSTAPLQDRQHAALRLVSEFGEEPRLRRVITESPGDYPINLLKSRYGYTLPEATPGPLSQSLKDQQASQPAMPATVPEVPGPIGTVKPADPFTTDFVSEAGKTARPWKATSVYRTATPLIKPGMKVVDYGSGPYQNVRGSVEAAGGTYVPFDRFGDIGSVDDIRNADLIMASNVLNVQSKAANPQAAYDAVLKELAEAMKPSGTLVVNMPTSGPRANWMTPKRLADDLKKQFGEVKRQGEVMIASKPLQRSGQTTTSGPSTPGERHAPKLLLSTVPIAAAAGAQSLRSLLRREPEAA